MSVGNTTVLFFMAKTRKQKEEQVKELASLMTNAKATVFANFQGLTVPEVEELRAKCRENDISVIASKKTLIKHALREAGHDVDTKVYEGGVAAFFGNSDEVVAAQTVANFAKTHEAVKIFGGILEGAYIDADKVTALSALPSREELLAKLVGSLNAPVSGFVNVLAGNLRGLVTVLGAIKDQKAEA